MDLDGSLTYSLGNDLTGYKIVAANNISNLVTSFNNLVKYDGKILKQAVDTSDGSWSDAANKIVYVGIPDIDSGWGETYVPSAAEIQAYFNGWKMYDNGADFTAKYSTGTKAWCYRADGSRGVSSGDYTGGTNTLPTTVAPNFKPYKLQYQLATSLVEEVQVEGAITLHEGLNQIEVGNGVQVRERANPNYYSVNNEYLINNTAFSPSQLTYRTQKILSVYRNEKIDQRFTNPTGSAYGNVQARIGAADYDPSASYTVTYFTLDPYKITCNLVQITAEYPTNIKTTIDQLAINQADMTTRIGVLENTKAGKVTAPMDCANIIERMGQYWWYCVYERLIWLCSFKR
jgi:hypothetical protein